MAAAESDSKTGWDAKYFLVIGVLAIVYFAAANYSLKLPLVEGRAALVWPPSGIAIAFAVLYGRGVWPGIALAVIAVLLKHDWPLTTAIGIAAGNSFEAVLASHWLVQYRGFDSKMERRSDVLGYVLIASLAAPVVSATFGVGTLVLTGLLPSAQVPLVWSAWWFGDASGALIVGSTLLIWSRSRRLLQHPSQLPESILLFTTLLFVTLAASGAMARALDTYAIDYMLFPVLVWAALRFGVRGTITSAFVVALVTLHCTIAGIGPFVRATPTEGLFTAQIFLSALTAFSVLLAAIASDYRKSQLALQRSQQQLTAALDRERRAFADAEGQRLRLENLFMQAPAMITMISAPDLRYELVNPSAAEFFSRVGGPSRFTGRRLEDVHAGEDRRTFVAPVEKVLATGQPFAVSELPIRRRALDGHLFVNYVNAVFQPLRDQDGRATGVIVFGMDVTNQVLAIREQRRMQAALRDSEREFRAMFEIAPLGCCQLGPDGRFLRVNDMFCKITGFSALELLNMTVNDLTHPDDQARTRESLLEVQQSGRPFHIEKRYVRKSGEVIWVSINAVFVYDSDGRPVRTISFVEDVTEQRTHLQRLSEEKRSAEVASHAKSSFLAAMSHEIRTPLGAILGFAEVLKEQEIKESDRRRYLDIIGRNGRELSRLIDDILDLSKVEAGRLNVERGPVSINGLVSDVVALLSQKARAKDIRLAVNLEPGVPETIQSDPTRLRQILINLVGNAIKFTKAGDVSLTVRMSGLEDGKIEFLVRDSGSGIDPSDHGKLFQPFSQTKTCKGKGGTGLGLFLSRRLAEALGGDVRLVESTPGHGSAFVATVAVGRSVMSDDGHAPSPAGPRADSLSGLKILVVDDSDDNRALVEHLLTKRGASVEVAHDGREGIEMALSHNYDLVLMDIQMPVLDGLTATQQLRKKGYRRPIVALTAHAMKEDRERALENGFDEHVAKPIVPNELMGAITHCVQTSNWYH
ncbi:MAG TPA: MASE1 domain-containing protein [Bdellovibrionales bacterium]|nr:MASE1 domain-containing protein [Bdellovibrionales bacterium]